MLRSHYIITNKNDFGEFYTHLVVCSFSVFISTVWLLSEIKNPLFLCNFDLHPVGFVSFPTFLQFFLKFHQTFFVHNRIMLNSMLEITQAGNVYKKLFSMKFVSYEWLFIDTFKAQNVLFSSRISYNATKNNSIWENNQMIKNL